MGLVLLSFFQAVPAAGHLDVAAAPGWARAVLFVASLQLAYAVWMVLVPDWSTVWVNMLVLTVVATLYAIVVAVSVMARQGEPLLLQLDEVRPKARLWCSAVLLLVLLMTYLCGRTSFAWRSGRRLSQP